jgi:hypothetical protein
MLTARHRPVTYRQRDPECGPFTEHAWAELAAGRYTITDGVLTLARPWRPEWRSTSRHHRPLVFLDAEGRRIA